MAQLLRTYRIEDIEESVPRGSLWRSKPGANTMWHPTIAKAGFAFLGAHLKEEIVFSGTSSTFQCFVFALPIGNPLPREFLFVEFPAPDCKRPITWPSGTYAEMFLHRWKLEFVRM